MSMIVAGVVVVVVIVGLYIALRSTNTTKEVPTQQQTPSDTIPTVDASTTVELKPVAGNKEIILTARGVPQGTSAVDYELSYETKAQGTQGVIGTVTTIANNTFEKQMTLGTCSSGKCVYHEVIGSIHVTLKFSGSYGEKILEKEFSL